MRDRDFVGTYYILLFEESGVQQPLYFCGMVGTAEGTVCESVVALIATLRHEIVKMLTNIFE